MLYLPLMINVTCQTDIPPPSWFSLMRVEGLPYKVTGGQLGVGCRGYVFVVEAIFRHVNECCLLHCVPPIY